MGEQAHQGEEERGDGQRGPESDGHQPADGIRLLLAPVLACQHHHSVADSEDELLEDELNLVHRRYAGEGGLRIAAQHHIVRQIHAEHHGLLEHQSAHELDKCSVE